MDLDERENGGEESDGRVKGGKRLEGRVLVAEKDGGKGGGGKEMEEDVV